MTTISPYRTSHTNPFNRPDIGLTDSAQWCAVCRSWDTGLATDEVAGIYLHPGHVMDAIPDSGHGLTVYGIRDAIRTAAAPVSIDAVQTLLASQFGDVRVRTYGPTVAPRYMRIF